MVLDWIQDQKKNNWETLNEVCTLENSVISMLMSYILIIVLWL